MNSRFDKYTVMPKFSLEPNRISYYNEIFYKKEISENVYELKHFGGGGNFERKFHNFEISKPAYRNLKRKINWLYYLAKPKKIKTYSGKSIFNFKICFLTLTLPTKQKHQTKFITKELLNQFLTEIRQRTGLKNYVWRLEFQKNRNVHYHIVADVYIDYFLALKIWNRILKKHGYIQDYTNKFSQLSLYQYNKLVNSNNKLDFSIINSRYLKGCREKWNNPNTVDVKSVISDKAIANYISKYFGKSSKGEAKCNKLDNEQNSKTMRLWFCSRSLSKLKSVSDFCEAVDYNLLFMVKKIAKVKEYVCEYAKIIFFDITDNTNKFAIFINQLLVNYAKNVNYVSSG